MVNVVHHILGIVQIMTLNGQEYTPCMKCIQFSIEMYVCILNLSEEQDHNYLSKCSTVMHPHLVYIESGLFKFWTFAW